MTGRIYDALDRLTQVTFNVGDTNLYAYVRNNPATLVDPTGKNPLLILAAAGCIGGAIDAGAMGGWSARKMGAGCAGGARHCRRDLDNLVF